MEESRRFFSKKDKRFLAVSLGLFAGAAILQLAARQLAGMGKWYAVSVYPVIVAVCGRVCGILPFSVAEIGAYVLIPGFILYGICHIREGGRILSRAVFVLAFLAFTYTTNCGVNYYRVPFSSYLDLEMRSSSEQELEELCEYLTGKVNETAKAVSYTGAWRQVAQDSMEKLGERYPELSGYYPLPKPLAVSRVLSVQQLSGIYIPFTVEANYNREMIPYNVPLTMCHELSHLKGFMREDEANFIGYLACIGSGDQAFLYSGYLLGWIYAANALAKQDGDRYLELYGQLNPQVQLDLKANSLFWDRFEGKVAEASNRLNDTYLKMNDQQDGVQSYGRMVDLMLAYYREEM